MKQHHWNNKKILILCVYNYNNIFCLFWIKQFKFWSIETRGVEMKAALQSGTKMETLGNMILEQTQVAESLCVGDSLKTECSSN